MCIVQFNVTLLIYPSWLVIKCDIYEQNISFLTLPYTLFNIDLYIQASR